MIRKEHFDKPRNAFYWVETILRDNKDYYLTKEEIYARIPTDEDNVPIVTISSLENALRNFIQMRCIVAEYDRGRRYFHYCGDEVRR